MLTFNSKFFETLASHTLCVHVILQFYIMFEVVHVYCIFQLSSCLTVSFSTIFYLLPFDSSRAIQLLTEQIFYVEYGKLYIISSLCTQSLSLDVVRFLQRRRVRLRLGQYQNRTYRKFSEYMFHLGFRRSWLYCFWMYEKLSGAYSLVPVFYIMFCVSLERKNVVEIDVSIASKCLLYIKMEPGTSAWVPLRYLIP